MIDPVLFENLRREFPSQDIFSANQKQPFSEGRPSRINLMRHDPLFREFMNKSEVWRSFYRQINSRDLVEQIVQLFDDNIQKHGGEIDIDNWNFSDHEPHMAESLMDKVMTKLGVIQTLDKIKSALMDDALCVSFDIAWARNGYWTEVHTDNRNKLSVFLIFFNETDGEGGDFHAYQLKDNLKRPDDLRYPRDDELDMIKTFEPKPNRGAIFMNCNRAYHGADRMSGSSIPRQFLYVAVCSRYSTPIWHEV